MSLGRLAAEASRLRIFVYGVRIALGLSELALENDV